MLFFSDAMLEILFWYLYYITLVMQTKWNALLNQFVIYKVSYPFRKQVLT